MLLNELDRVIDNNTDEALDLRRPSTKNEKKRGGNTKSNLANKSPLVHRKKGSNSSKSGVRGKGGSGKKRSSKASGNNRKKRQNTTTKRLCCSMCVMLVKMTNQMLRTDHDESDCPNNDEYQEACKNVIKKDDGDPSMKTEGEV